MNKTVFPCSFSAAIEMYEVYNALSEGRYKGISDSQQNTFSQNLRYRYDFQIPSIYIVNKEKNYLR